MPSQRRQRSAGDTRCNRFEGGFGLGRIRTASLREIGSAAAAFATERFGADLDQVNGADLAHEIGSDADGETGLALGRDADHGDDPRADLGLALVDQSP